MKLICTYCSGPKREDGGLLPAVDRYLSERIVSLFRHARETGATFCILSGEFGLLKPEHPIPWYDHLLLPAETSALTTRVAGQLSGLEIETVEYHTADADRYPDVVPYRTVITAACRAANKPLTVVELAGNPD